MDKWELIEQSADAIQQVVDEYQAGWVNTEAINKIKAEVFKIRQGPRAAYISEKVASLEHDVDVLYSPRKAAKWGGPDQVKYKIRIATTSIKDHARIRRNAEAGTDYPDQDKL